MGDGNIEENSLHLPILHCLLHRNKHQQSICNKLTLTYEFVQVAPTHLLFRFIHFFVKRKGYVQNHYAKFCEENKKNAIHMYFTKSRRNHANPIAILWSQWQLYSMRRWLTEYCFFCIAFPQSSSEHGKVEQSS